MSAYAIPCAVIAFISMLCIGRAAVAGQTNSPPSAAEGSAKAFNALDADRNGSLSPQEFDKGYLGLRQAMAAEARLREQFQLIDADHGGALDAEEYANLALVKRAGPTAPGLSAFDANKDRKLEFDEYLVAVRALFGQGQKTRGSGPRPTNDARGHR